MKLSALKLALLLSAGLATGVMATQAHAAPLTDAGRAQILKAVDADAPQIQDAALKIWGFAEVGYQEVKSSALLQGQLKTAGFDVMVFHYSRDMADREELTGTNYGGDLDLLVVDANDIPGLPFPRGLQLVDGRLYVLCRGRVREYGGVTAAVEDQAGSLYVVDPDVAEVYGPGEPSPEVRENGEIVAAPTSPPFRLWDRTASPPWSDRETDRPYCGLAWHPGTRSFYICAFSGVDRDAKTGTTFSKNLTAIFYYDHSFSKAVISTAFPITNIRSGFTLRYNFGN